MLRLQGWKFYIIVCALVLTAGVFIGAALDVSQTSISLVANIVNAFGTVLLGVAAIYGVKNWYKQQEFLKRGQRAEEALRAISPLELHVKQMRSVCDKIHSLRNSSLDKDATTNMKFLISDIHRTAESLWKQMEIANQIFFWFSSDAIKENVGELYSASYGLKLAPLIGWGSDPDSFELDLDNDEAWIALFIENTLQCADSIDKDYAKIQQYLLPIANLEHWSVN